MRAPLFNEVQEKGDEVLKRMLKTPPDPKAPPKLKPGEGRDDEVKGE